MVLNDSIDISLQIPRLAPLTRTSTYITRQVHNPVTTESPTGTTSNCNTNGGHPGCNVSGSHQASTPMSTQYGGAIGTGYIMDDYEISYAYEYENFPVLLPYHTLLFLEDPEEILKDIPLDTNPTLVKLVQTLAPHQWYVHAHREGHIENSLFVCATSWYSSKSNRSFSLHESFAPHSLDELQYILDCSMAQIYRLASHLIYWRKAKLIDQIRVSNVYVVAPQAGINEYETLHCSTWNRMLF